MATASTADLIPRSLLTDSKAENLRLLAIIRRLSTRILKTDKFIEALLKELEAKGITREQAIDMASTVSGVDYKQLIAEDITKHG